MLKRTFMSRFTVFHVSFHGTTMSRFTVFHVSFHGTTMSRFTVPPCLVSRYFAASIHGIRNHVSKHGSFMSLITVPALSQVLNEIRATTGRWKSPMDDPLREGGAGLRALLRVRGCSEALKTVQEAISAVPALSWSTEAGKLSLRQPWPFVVALRATAKQANGHRRASLHRMQTCKHASKHAHKHTCNKACMRVNM